MKSLKPQPPPFKPPDGFRALSYSYGPMHGDHNVRAVYYCTPVDGAVLWDDQGEPIVPGHPLAELIHFENDHPRCSAAVRAHGRATYGEDGIWRAGPTPDGTRDDDAERFLKYIEKHIPLARAALTLHAYCNLHEQARAIKEWATALVNVTKER